MKVGLGVTALARCIATNGVDGIGNHTHELYRRLIRHQSLQVLPVSFGYHGFEQIDGNAGIVLKRFAPLVATSVLTGLPFWGYDYLKNQIDVFHATDHRIPRLGKIPIVTTIHDAIPLAHPEWGSLKHRIIITPVFRQSVRWANRVITVSEYSKGQIVEHFGISPEKIVVIHNGVDSRWFKPIVSAELEALRSKYKLSRRYVVCVGTLQPRKNIDRLIKAYQALPKPLLKEFDLLIVGRAGWGSDNLLLKLKDSIAHGYVHWLEYLPNTELEILVKGASCLALPSLAEGFGLPVIEGFAAGVPVITSNTSSLPEIAGDAAVLVNPYDVEAISDGLRCLLEDSELAGRLREKGLDRAKCYSWDRMAESTVSVYHSVA